MCIHSMLMKHTVQVSARTAKYIRALARSFIEGETHSPRERFGDVPDGPPFVKAVRAAIRDGDIDDDVMVRDALAAHRDASEALAGRAS